MRVLFAVAVAALLAGCSPQYFFDSFTPYGVETDPFGVTSLTGVPKEPAYAAFNNADPGAGAKLAQQTCTLGQRLTDVGTMPGDTADFRVQQVDCTRYRAVILPPI
jgi:hypothetical protein